MGFGDIHGRARVSLRYPEGFGVCDDCGEFYNRVDLIDQYEYYGNTLKWTGYVKCRRCLDKPQAQLQTPILPRDPYPIINPRIENTFADFGLQGFTQFTLEPPLRVGDGKAAVLAAVAALSGVPTPNPINDQSGTITARNIAQALVGANAARTFLLIYNPTDDPYAVSFGQATFGDLSTVMVGPGNALFWATAQGLGAPSGSAMTIIGYAIGSAFFAWDAPSTGGFDLPVLFP